MYADHSGHFPILGLILGTIIGVASGSISVISQAVISPILNTLLAQGVTDVMTLGTTAGATYLGYLTGKLVVKGVKAVGKEFKKIWKRINTPGSGPGGLGDVYYNSAPETIMQFGKNVMTSYGGTFTKQFDDGDDSWDIFDYPY